LTKLYNIRELSYGIQRTSWSSLTLFHGNRRELFHERVSNYSPAASSSESQTSSNNSQKPDSDQRQADAASNAADAAGEKAQKDIDNLLTVVEEYKGKLAAVEDKYKRQLAETENVRQRFMRQVEEAKTFGIQNFCKDLLEIADVLELATESVPKDALSNPDNVALKQLYDGLIMTQTQLAKIFTKHGLVAVKPEGEKFNPNMHEAVFQVPDKSKESGSVANVVKIGYLLNDRLIRPAKVGVYISP